MYRGDGARSSSLSKPKAGRRQPGLPVVGMQNIRPPAPLSAPDTAARNFRGGQAERREAAVIVRPVAPVGILVRTPSAIEQLRRINQQQIDPLSFGSHYAQISDKTILELQDLFAAPDQLGKWRIGRQNHFH